MFKVLKKIKENKIVKFIVTTFRVILAIFAISSLIIVLVQRVSNNNLSIFGYRIFSVITKSMEPEYKVGDVLVSKEVKYSDINIDDNVVYIGTQNTFKDKIITHKVISKFYDNDKKKFMFQTKGIANSVADPIIEENQILGVVKYKPFIFSMISQAMTNMIAYFAIFTVLSVIVSYDIVSSIYNDKEEELDEEEVI